MRKAELVVLLANLTAERRPDRGPAFRPDPLSSRETAAGALGVDDVVERDLVQLRELHRVVVRLVDGLIAGHRVMHQMRRLNDLASASQAQVHLDRDDEGLLVCRQEWWDETVTSKLARQIVAEMGEIDLARLRRCQRTPCRLVFYDTTRSNTQRWHAESPCGNRTRQQRFRSRHHA